MEENQLPLEQSVQPKKRGRKPKNAQLEVNQDITLVEEKAPKKRGRKSKTEISETSDVLAENIAQEKAKAKKGKSSKRLPRTDGPQWRDAPELPQTDSSEENQQQEEILFVASESDDFAFATQVEDEKPEEMVDDFDEDIPTSYSTTDDDLIQDNYQNSWSADDDEFDNSNDSVDVAEPDTSLPDAIATEEKQNNQRNQQNNQRNQQNNRQNKWRNNKDNRFNNKNNNQNRNQQNNQQNNKFNKNNNQNRNQQNNQRNQQNKKQNQQNNNNNQNQKNKANKPKWLQQSTQGDFINPSDLFDWDVLKSVENIEKYIAEIYFGKVSQQPENFGQEEQPQTTDLPEIQAEQNQLPDVAENIEEQSAKVEDENVVVEQQSSEPEPLAQEQQSAPSYWEMLEQSNKEMFDKSTADVPNEEKPQVAEVEQIQPIDAPTLENEEEVFEETYTFNVAECGEVSSLENFNTLYEKPLKEIENELVEMGMQKRFGLNKNALLQEYYNIALTQKKLVKVSGVLDVFDDGYGGAIVFNSDNYRLRKFSVYVPKLFIEKYSLARGHKLTVLAAPPKREGSCPFAVKITSVMDSNPNSIKNLVAFNDLVPYYPTERIIMESSIHNARTNVSMRAVDLLAPIGLGQRALIVAPPRTGKTVLMQTMAKSIRDNKPNAHLIVLLVDERPEEVTDFKRSVDAEVVASTFDEEASNHVHAAEMVISYARRMVEKGKDVIILLDSITRLARAYNALMPNGGRTMSGGVEANALQKPKKFFGSARNIEGGGSLTIIGTALVETGSKMDEVIFEEFKGTGHLELHLDRALSDKRIFPAINMEKTGTRKEELLYHPDELEKIYTLRRAMHGVPITESMEMLVQRLKKTKTNVEFLLGLNR